MEFQPSDIDGKKKRHLSSDFQIRYYLFFFYNKVSSKTITTLACRRPDPPKSCNIDLVSLKFWKVPETNGEPRRASESSLEILQHFV